MGVISLVLIALAAPLVAAQVWIIAGMFRSEKSSRSAGAPRDWSAVLPAHPAADGDGLLTGNPGNPGADGTDTPSSPPSVSVIIPAHDEERRLPSTLLSLAAIDYPGQLEFVLVNDRSTDATPTLLAEAAAADPRIRVVTLSQPSRRYAPKVNAVMHGIASSSGEVIVTSDADCSYSPGWVSALVAHLRGDVAMVCGYVETLPARTGRGRLPWWRWLEAADWFSLMLVSRSMLRFGRSYASSANNQAYRRSALLAAGGFGASARAPSGDEDLLAQRLGAHGRVVFAADRDARVRTSSAGSLVAFLRQRSRWVARYRHAVHYRPAFLLGLSVLGFESIAISLSLLALPLVPQLAPVVLGCYLAQTIAMLVGMNIGAVQLDRRELGGLVTFWWALAHPFIIAVAVVWSWLAPGDWRAGAVGYRRSLARRRWRLLVRSLTARL